MFQRAVPGISFFKNVYKHNQFTLSVVFPQMFEPLKILFESLQPFFDKLDLDVLKNGIINNSFSSKKTTVENNKEIKEVTKDNESSEESEEIQSNSSMGSTSSSHESEIQELNMKFNEQIQIVLEAITSLSKQQEIMTKSFPPSFYFCFKIIFAVIDKLVEYQDTDNEIKLGLFNSILKTFYGMFLKNEKIK